MSVRPTPVSTSGRRRSGSSGRRLRRRRPRRRCRNARQRPELARRGTDRREIEASAGPAGAGIGFTPRYGLERAGWPECEAAADRRCRTQAAEVVVDLPIGSKTISVAADSECRRGGYAVGSAKAGGGSEASKGRHSQRVVAEPAGSRFEPGCTAHSASLRDGPPKVLRGSGVAPHRSGGTRRFREYSSVTKDGVTVMVPNREVIRSVPRKGEVRATTCPSKVDALATGSEERSAETSKRHDAPGQPPESWRDVVRTDYAIPAEMDDLAARAASCEEGLAARRPHAADGLAAPAAAAEPSVRSASW